MAESVKSDSLYTALRSRILNGELRPGQSLRLRALAQSLGGSATPVREALNRLHAENFVTTEANKGFRVATVTLEELEDLESARSAIETQLLLRSIEKGGRDWEANLVSAHYRLSKCQVPNSFSQSQAIDLWDTAHTEFHFALIAGASSIWLMNFARQVNAQLQRYRRHIILRIDHLNRTSGDNGAGALGVLSREALGIDAHTALMQAALDRDKAKAEALMLDHVRLAKEAFLKLAKASGIAGFDAAA
ncbi:GntR family transcriptional regulator [Phyllobacterium zundukense]|uniref:GntR family transcriptional regulator n=1 Tax=Phyllobacterium zundukense TaxID=1867719 RepID=UPI00138FDE3A|nr:GntR family transcriptional regulator [Phyllobacterium zundukense]